MSELQNVREMLEAAMVQAANECGILLGHDLYLKGTVAGEIARDAYIQELTGASYVVGMESEADYPGKMYLVLSLGDTIILSSTLLGIPQGRVAEKKTLAIFEHDDSDAFSEIANQITGSFNTVIQPFLPRKMHLKQLEPEKYLPPENASASGGPGPLAAGEYFILKAQLEMTGFELERFDLLVPLPLARQFNIQDRKKSAKDEVGDPSLDSEDERFVSEGDEMEGATVLILEDNAVERRQFEDMLTGSGIRPLAVPFDADLKKLVAKRSVKAVLLGVVNADEQDLALCIKIANLFTDLPAPIIMCARQWTRTGVLKALKYGAREILLKPCSSDELFSKVMKLVHAG